MSKNGGPAFPETQYTGNTDRRPGATTPGMTLRDYFAAKALPVVLETMPSPPEMKGVDPEKLAEAIASVTARWAYAMADALLAERAK